jgi:serine/threonine protein phosphatase PrpC
MKTCIENIVSFSDKGVRKNNEDNHDTYAAVDGSGILLVLADGMGGHSSGEVASECAVTVLVKMFTKHQFDDSEKLLEDAILSAHERIHLEATRDAAREGMGTTVVAVVIRDDEAIVGHVGDSRAIQFKGELVRRLTRDHLYAIDVLDCDEATAKSSPQGNVLSQALGIDGKISPTVNRFGVDPGDLIVLCRDGVSEHVPEPMMWKIINEQTFEKTAQVLVNTAIENGSRDNCTAIVARIA